MKANAHKFLATYKRNLARYEAQGDADRVRVQKALIAKIEASK